jgi:hypothetical protein
VYVREGGVGGNGLDAREDIVPYDVVLVGVVRVREASYL